MLIVLLENKNTKNALPYLAKHFYTWDDNNIIEFHYSRRRGDKWCTPLPLFIKSSNKVSINITKSEHLKVVVSTLDQKTRRGKFELRSGYIRNWNNYVGKKINTKFVFILQV